jgi:hypothetical protein
MCGPGVIGQCQAIIIPGSRGNGRGPRAVKRTGVTLITITTNRDGNTTQATGTTRTTGATILTNNTIMTTTMMMITTTVTTSLYSTQRL